MIGCNCRRPRGGCKIPVWREALAVVLSFAILSSGVPAPAWAQGVEGSQVISPGDVALNPDAEHPDLPSDWAGFGNGGTGYPTQAPTPTGQTDMAWAKSLLKTEEVDAGASLSVSDPLIIGGNVYVVTASTTYDPVTWVPTRSLARLQVIDRETGGVEREVVLGSPMDYVCRPVYTDGIVVIPLAGGYLQAVSAKTLETLWVAPSFTDGQSMSTLTVGDGYVYVAVFDELDGDVATTGSVRRYNVRTGALSGEMKNGAAGYYWAGGVMVAGHYAIGDDSGTVHVLSADLSREVSSVDLGDAPVRSSLVKANGHVYAVTRDGCLHVLDIDGDGAPYVVSSVRFADSSTSTPTITDGYAFVGGSLTGEAGVSGVLAVIDLSTMAVRKVATADDALILGEVKSAPLVSVQADGTYAYFTSNEARPYPDYSQGGGIYIYRLGDAEASVLFQPGPGMAQYCMASVFCDSEGNLYYTNDSGNLFKVVSRGDSIDDGGGNHGQDDGAHVPPAPEPGEDAGAGAAAPHRAGDANLGTKAAATPVMAAPHADGDGENDEAKAPVESTAKHVKHGAVVAPDPSRTSSRMAIAAGAVGLIGLAVAAVWAAMSRRGKEA